MERKKNKKDIPILLVPGDHSSDYDPDVPTREAILAYFRQNKGLHTIEGLCEYFKLKRDASIEGLERRLTSMVKDDQLRTQAGKWGLSNSNQFAVTGVVQGHKDGFGFLLPDDKTQQDIFLSPTEMRKVLHGDRVSVKPTGSYKGKLEGTIIEVLERGTSRLVGRLLHENGCYVVAPEDQRIKHDIFIADSDIGDAQVGQVVTVEIIHQPTRQTLPQGRVIEVLGAMGDPGMEIEIAVRKFDVPYQFSQAALEQADRLPDEVRSVDLKGRVDLRDVPFITIDGEDARDFDDAVYAELTTVPSGTRHKKVWRLLVAIADVSHYVKDNDALDADAQERSTSVYFPRRVIPMLPEKLSNGLCSLNPHVDRLTLVCDMVIAATGVKAGTVQAYQFYPAVINSHERTTYTQVWDAIQAPENVPELAAILPQICDLYGLYQLLLAQRKKRGAMEFDTVETKIVCDDMGKIEKIVPFYRNDAHRLIEECMLAANTCAAEFIEHHDRQGLYRVHEGPTPEKLEAFQEFLHSVGLYLEGGQSPTSLDYADLIDRARGREDFQFIQSMAMRSMQQAIYTPENSGHFGLSYEAYAHFTSPIRRYPDLLTHRVIKAILKGQDYIPTVKGLRRAKGEPLSEYAQSVWEKLGIICSAHERRADEASYDVQAWLKCWYARHMVGDIFVGKVTGVASFGLFVTLEGVYIEGLVHVTELGDEYFQYNQKLHELRGERTGKRYRLTDTINVQITRVDLETRRIDFAMVKPTATYQSVQRELTQTDKPRKQIKRAAKPKPTALKGLTAKQRRAQQAKRSRQGGKKPVAKKTARAGQKQKRHR